jgi:large subunit ribosomal protein L25
MADRAVIKAEVRTGLGSKYAVALRREGKLPAIVYGHKKDPVAISFDLHEFVEYLHHGNRLFDVDMAGKKETLLIKDLQYDHLGRYVIHADMVRVNLEETIKVVVPIAIKGTSKGSHEGGIIDEVLDHVEVMCRVADIPESIEVSVKELGVGDAIHARDVELPDGMTLATDPGALILTCHLVAAAKSTEQLEEEMPAGPEVITEKPAEGEEGAEGTAE